MRKIRDTSKFEDWIDSAVEALTDCMLRARKNGHTPEAIVALVTARAREHFKNDVD